MYTAGPHKTTTVMAFFTNNQRDLKKKTKKKTSSIMLDKSPTDLNDEIWQHGVLYITQRKSSLMTHRQW